MANVSFLRGTQAKLDKLTSFTEGAFYLTTDSDRLYFAQSASELVHLNHNVIHVASVASLPAIATAHVGDFYYALSENVLCTKAAEGNNAWTQINKNSNDDTKVTGIDDMQVVSSADGGITVSFDIKQSTTDVHGDISELADIPVSFTIKGSDIATANNVDVGVATSAVTGGVKIATTGDGSSGAGFNVTKGNDNVSIVRDSTGNVTISAVDTTYDIGAADNNIVLKDSNGDDHLVALAAGNDAVSITGADDTITVTHKDYGSKAAVSTTATAAPAPLGTFTVVDSITTDKGHVTAYNVKTVTMPDDTKSAISTETGNIIRLTESNGDSTDVTLAAANSDITLATDADADKISIGHKVYNAPDVTSATAVSPKHGGSFTVVDSIETSNGHITGYKTKQVNLPTDNDTKVTGVSASANNEGKLTVTVTDSHGDPFTGTSGQDLYYTVNGTKVYNQGAIDFYTKDEIDTMVESVNAMVYKGTVGTGGTVTSLPTANVQVGDTYKVAVAGTYGGHSCEVGDLLIALGTETDGVITSGLTWTYVPSGDDVDSQYELNVASNTITLKNTVTKDEVGSATIAAGNDIKVSTSGTTITVKHEDFTTTKGTDVPVEPDAGTTVTVLDSITTDNGHVTGYVNKVITLPKDTTSALSVAAGNVIRLTESNGDTSDVTLAGDGTYISLASDTAAKKITASHKTYGTLSATKGTDVQLSHEDAAKNNFTVVTGVTRDSGGHLSGFTTQKFTLPTDNNTTSSIGVASGNIIRLTESDGDTSDVTLTQGTQMAITTNTDNKSITIGHGTITTTKGADVPAQPEAGTAVTVLDSITVNNGHVTGYANKVITLPKDTTYSVAGAVANANNVATYTTTLTASTGDSTSSAVKITSDNLKVTSSSNTVTMNLEWGSF